TTPSRARTRADRTAGVRHRRAGPDPAAPAPMARPPAPRQGRTTRLATRGSSVHHDALEFLVGDVQRAGGIDGHRRGTAERAGILLRLDDERQQPVRKTAIGPAGRLDRGPRAARRRMWTADG